MNIIEQNKLSEWRENLLSAIAKKIESNITPENPTGKTEVDIELCYFWGVSTPHIRLIQFYLDAEDGIDKPSKDRLDFSTVIGDYAWSGFKQLNTDNLAKIADALGCNI